MPDFIAEDELSNIIDIAEEKTIYGKTVKLIYMRLHLLVINN